MTQFFSYAGADLGATTVRLEDGIAGFTENADGTFAVGGVQIDDPSGALTFIELQEFTHRETACSVQRTFTGYLTNMRSSRQMFKTGAGRRYDFELIDLNYRLHLQPLRGASAKRPVETGDARLAWLLSSVALAGIVFDNGLVGSNPNSFDAADYTGLYADAVLVDLCVSSSAETGRIYFVYYDTATGQPSLFIDLPTAATNTSTLSISNVLADSSATCFPPNEDADLGSSGEDIYCSVFFKYKTGQIYRHNDTTHATYFAGSGYHRQAVFETTRVGSLATATRHADAFLANHAGTLDTITCTVRLPAASVNLVRAGHRIQCKFSHLPGFSTNSYLRVSSRTVLLTPGTNSFYDVHLTLTNRSLTPVGGGGTGEFPAPPPSPPGLVQQKGAANIVTLDTIPVDGDLLMMWVTMRTFATYPSVPAGWTLVETVENNVGPYHSAILATRIASGESGTYANTAGTIVHVSEWSGGTLGAFVSLNDQPLGSAVTAGGAITPAAANAVVVGCGLYGGFSAVGVTAGAGVTELFQQQSPGGLSPTSWVGLKNVATPVSTTIPGTISPAEVWAGVTYSLEAVAADTPPVTGQWVYKEAVTMVGTTGTVSQAFANGSLHVFYDIVDQTPAIVSYDGAAKTFVMPSLPPYGTQVFATYQAL